MAMSTNISHLSFQICVDMAGAIIDIDDYEVIATLTRLQHLVGDLTSVFHDLCELLTPSTAERFRAGEDPDRRKWQE